ncbi:MAG: glutamine--fructose-6-phosphate transaminase (isomerizing) [Gammaproteobacteria bacterium]|nr:glutamine--fructose-6-phosphate transaminase (isomerizing) [Gammaproteobacteria bacterium]
MCGIVGAIAQRDVSGILLDGLKRLEYRGYDSAGIAILNGDRRLERVRVCGKVRELTDLPAVRSLHGGIGIAHTRWATHGEPSVNNAHPHVCSDIALVHNGIIENHEQLRRSQRTAGYQFQSETDTEVIVNQIHRHAREGGDLLTAVQRTLAELNGAYAIGVMSASEPKRLVAARSGSPLVIGIGRGEHFIASDILALLPVTRRFIILEDGDVADVSSSGVVIYDRNGRKTTRPIVTSELSAEATDKGGYRHYMLKEIYAQPVAVAETLRDRTGDGRVLDESFGAGICALLDRTRAVQIVACGTSYHAGLVARCWLETMARVPCSVEYASEYRHRRPLVPPGTLLVVISQSGETLDTLAALRGAQGRDYVGSLAICNVDGSSLTREADHVLLTRAGPEIGVASTKAFTTQLVVLLLLAIMLGRRQGLAAADERALVEHLSGLPDAIRRALELNDSLAELARRFVGKQHALYLGRGPMLPVAMEGALKLKEISYIHAEAYPAGELKHGPLALVDDTMPVVAVAPNDDLLEKLKSNLHEVRARGGELYVFKDAACNVEPAQGMHAVDIAPIEGCLAPIVYTVPLQLLAYHVAILKGADVDQPRNLAKSVTVE